MFEEAAEAADAVRRQATCKALEDAAQALSSLAPNIVLTCARGSSDHAATFAQYVFPTLLGLPCYSHPPSIGSLLDATSARLGGGAMLLISQSGASPDLLRSAAAARSAGMRIFVLVNDTSSPLAEMADHLIPMHAGRERSVAATKSFIASLSAIAGLAARTAHDTPLLEALSSLPDALERAWDVDWEQAVDLCTGTDNLYVLGRGLTLGIAGEAALKLKEVAGIHAEAFSFAEVAHGPMALIGPSMPILAFSSDTAISGGGDALLARFRDRGAKILTVGSSVAGAAELPLQAAHPVTRAILAIQSFYRVAETVARNRSIDPDRPPGLAKVTETL